MRLLLLPTNVAKSPTRLWADHDATRAWEAWEALGGRAGFGKYDVVNTELRHVARFACNTNTTDRDVFIPSHFLAMKFLFGGAMQMHLLVSPALA